MQSHPLSQVFIFAGKERNVFHTYRRWLIFEITLKWTVQHLNFQLCQSKGRAVAHYWIYSLCNIKQAFKKVRPKI